MLQYQKVWNEVESQLFEKLTTKPFIGESKCMYGKLKTWKECIETNSQGQEIPYDVHCNATPVLKDNCVQTR